MELKKSTIFLRELYMKTTNFVTVHPIKCRIRYEAPNFETEDMIVCCLLMIIVQRKCGER
jgi:hypothetical protein